MVHLVGPYLVVIRGPLGVGKTTVSEALARRLGARHVSIDDVLEKNGLEEWDADRISLPSFLRANEFVEATARGELEHGIPVVVDGNFYWKEAIEDLCRRLQFEHFVVTLTAPVEVCIARDRRRPPTPPDRSPRAGDSLGAEAVRDVFRLVSSVPYGSEVDATGSVGETVETILQLLRSHQRV